MTTIVDGLPTAKYVLFSMFYAVSILGVMFGICGIFGAIRKNRCLLCMYSVAIVFMTLLGASVGTAGLVFFPQVFQGTTCSTAGSNGFSPFIPTFNSYYA